MKNNLFSIPNNFKVKKYTEYPISENEYITNPFLTKEEMPLLIENIILGANNFNNIIYDDSEILKSILEAVELWLSKNDSNYDKCIELLNITTGFSKEVIEKGLESILLPIKFHIKANNARLQFRKIKKDFYKVNFISLAGNIPGSGLYSILYHLILGIPAVVKMSTGDPVFPALFWNTITDKLPIAKELISILYWMGGKWIFEKEFYSYFEKAVIYGSNATIERLSPFFQETIDYGHKVSFGIIDSESAIDKLNIATCEKIAFDIFQFDQQGCLSPHFYFVIGTHEDAISWSEKIFEAMQNINKLLPVNERALEVSSQIRELRASYLYNEEAKVYSSDKSIDFTIVVEKDTSFIISPTGRTIFVKAINSFDEIIKNVIEMKNYLQGVSIISDTEKFDIMSKKLYNIGVSFCAKEGMIQYPPFGWLNSGINELDWLSRDY